MPCYIEIRKRPLGQMDSPLGFFQQCWEMINEDLLRVFLEFHNNGMINQSTNATFIALVQKKESNKQDL